MSEQFTAPELLAALKVERERGIDNVVRFGEVAESMVEAERDRHGNAAANLVESRDQAVQERDEAREQAALYQRSLEMLVAEDERAKVAASLAAANEAYNQMAAKYDALAADVRKVLGTRRHSDGITRIFWSEGGPVNDYTGIAEVFKAVEPLESRP